MRKKAIMLAAASVFCLGAPTVSAQTTAPTDEPEATAEEPDDSNVIKCERQAVTGSRARKKRVCLTMAEWRARRAAGQRTADAILQDASRGFPEIN